MHGITIFSHQHSLQILLLTPQSELGKVVGEILSKASGTSYWDNPFQVTRVRDIL